MICAIMQPTYLPWLGYFDMIDQVDTFVFLTNVQLVKRSWQVRNRIKTSNGELYLSIPIKKIETSRPLIKDAVIACDEKWIDNHLKSISYAYKKTPYFNIVFEWFADILHFSEKLDELNIKIISEICRKIGIKTPLQNSSEFGDLNFSKDNLLVEICKKIGADTYLSAKGSADYIEKETPGGCFTNENLRLYYHNYIHPNYPQLGKEFLPYMCILDLLFNVGFDDAINVIRSGRAEKIYYLNLNAK